MRNGSDIKTYVIGLNTFTPTSYSQEELLKQFKLVGNKFAEAIAKTSVIDSRCFLGSPSEMLTADLGIKDSYNREATTLMASEALKKASDGRVRLDQLDAVIAVYSSGAMMPGVAEILGEKYKIGNKRSLRFNLVGHGCYGAIPGLQLAQSLIESGKCKTIAVICTEAALTVVNPDNTDPSCVVPKILCGEGAVAVILANEDMTEGKFPRIIDSDSFMAEESLDYVTIRLTPSWFESRLDKNIPIVGHGVVPPLVNDFLRERNLELKDIKHWAFHSGGRRILELYQSAFNISDEQMLPSYEVLRKYGNIQSCSMLFSFHEILQYVTPKKGDLGLAVAIGPGMLAGVYLLEW